MRNGTEVAGNECPGGLMRLFSALSMVCCLLIGGTTAFAQTVYETRGANGPVFSDKPQPGARAIELRPLNVIEKEKLTGNNASEKDVPPPAPSKATGGKTGNEKAVGDKESSQVYRSFAIVFPENDGSILANTAVFEVRVAVDPALRLDEGHAFSVRVNGQPVAQRFTATEFTIPPEFWGDQMPPPNQRLQLGAAIVDRNGVVLKEATPIQFQLRYATLLQRPHPLRPQPHSEPKAKPETHPKAVMKQLPDTQASPAAQIKPMSR